MPTSDVLWLHWYVLAAESVVPVESFEGRSWEADLSSGCSSGGHSCGSLSVVVASFETETRMGDEESEKRHWSLQTGVLIVSQRRAHRNICFIRNNLNQQKE